MSNEEAKDPTPEEQGSEVARLLRKIQEEYEAAKSGLTGLALGTAQHDFITAKMENIEVARENLESIVGPDEAIRLVVEQISASYEKTQELKEDEEDSEKTQELKEDEGENNE